VTDSAAVAPGVLRLRSAPNGLPDPDPDLRPPVLAESDDPFSALRVVHLLARIERGRPVRLDDLVDQLNAIHLDWLFTRAVVADVLLQLQANWMADYRNASGIVVEDGPYGATVRPSAASTGSPADDRPASAARASSRLSLTEVGDGVPRRHPPEVLVHVSRAGPILTDRSPAGPSTSPLAPPRPVTATIPESAPASSGLKLASEGGTT
jgi:hypothetical protein